MDDIKVKFGNKIKALRQKRKISQEDLAAAIEITSAALSALETGKSFVSYKTLCKMCEVLNVKTRDLFDFDDTTINSEEIELIKEIEHILPNLDSEKLYYIKVLARTFADRLI